MKNFALCILIGVSAFIASCGGGGEAATNFTSQAKILTDLTAEVGKVTDQASATSLTDKFTKMGGEFKVLVDKAKSLTGGMDAGMLKTLTDKVSGATGGLSAAVAKLVGDKPDVGKIVQAAFDKFKGLAGL